MLIVCPACASEYRIEAGRVGAAGRSVRCAACRETWFITPDAVAEALRDEALRDDALRAEPAGARTADDGAPAEDGDESRGAAPSDAAWESEQVAPVIDQPAPPPRPAARRPAKGRPAKGRPAKGRRPAKPISGKIPPLLAAGLAVCALLPVALLGRASVVRAMPQTAGLFATIGLPVNLRGIDLRDVAAFQTAADGDKPAQLVVEGDLVGLQRGGAPVPPIEIEVRGEQGQTLYRWSVPAPRASLAEGERARFRGSLSAPPAQGRHVEVRFAAVPAETASPAAQAAQAAHLAQP